MKLGAYTRGSGLVATFGLKICALGRNDAASDRRQSSKNPVCVTPNKHHIWRIAEKYRPIVCDIVDILAQGVLIGKALPIPTVLAAQK